MAATLGIDELQKLFDFRRSPTSLQEGPSFLAALARESAFLNARVFPLLKQAERGRDWYVAYRHDAPDSSYSLQVFAWPSGSRTEIHDHSSWGAYCCVVGSVLETRYERLDDRLRPNRACLEKDWQLMWSLEDGISTVLSSSALIVARPWPPTTPWLR